jgi:hypothetical protein
VAEPIRFEPGVSQHVRGGELREQGSSTYRLATEALREGRFEEARRLGRFTQEEAREGRELYPMFAKRARAFLLKEGMAADRLAKEEHRILDALRLPDGSPFDLERGWEEFVAVLDEFETACDRGDATAAHLALEGSRSAWRRTHDRACDLVYGLLDICARFLGEERIGEVWDHLMEPIYPSRDRYDPARAPWAESVESLVVDAATSLRGHLSGPDRLGEVELEEEDDRWVLRFDPCGSGGRTYRPDADEGTPPRMVPPYNYAVTKRKYDWAWNTEGVCLYCVHCCQLQERAPIRRFGYPLRIVDPPVWPGGAERKCTWSVYKDPSLVPDEAFRRVGAERPPRPGPPAGTATPGSPGAKT